MVAAFIVLLLIVFLGILFDIIGVAVMSANEKPFHSMAAKKLPGAVEAMKLLRSAEKVSSFCNDVVGDICGVVGDVKFPIPEYQVYLGIRIFLGIVLPFLQTIRSVQP